MSPAYRAAGIAILRYAYETCDALKLDKGQLPNLFTELRDAIVVGQHPKPVLPDLDDWTCGPGERLPDRVIDQIRQMHSDGMNYHQIALALNCSDWVVAKYCSIDLPVETQSSLPTTPDPSPV